MGRYRSIEKGIVSRRKNGVLAKHNAPWAARYVGAARQTGLKYWLSDTVGNDLNDDWCQSKVKTALNLQRFIMLNK